MGFLLKFPKEMTKLTVEVCHLCEWVCYEGSMNVLVKYV